MKKLSLIKKIALSGSSIAAITPICISLSNCAPKNIDITYISFNRLLSDKSYNHAKNINVSFRKLLYGSKKFINGNYILIISSNTIDKCVEFFTGEEYGIRDKEKWYNNVDYDYFNRSYFYNGVLDTIAENQNPKHLKINNFGIINVIDFFSGNVYDKKGHKIYVSYGDNKVNDKIDPWQKWTTEIIAQTSRITRENTKNSYKWNSDSVSTKEYIRNDASAIAYRAFCKLAAALYPEKGSRDEWDDFIVEPDKNKVQVAVFVDGKLKTKKDIVSKQDWTNVILKYYEEKDEDEDE